MLLGGAALVACGDDTTSPPAAAPVSVAAVSCGDRVEDVRTVPARTVPDAGVLDDHDRVVDEDGEDDDDDPVHFALCIALCGEWYGQQRIRFDALCPPEKRATGVPGCEVVSEGDTSTITCSFASGRVAGRRMRGEHVATPTDSWLSSMSSLEHEAVEAFEELARDLTTWSAPTELVARARRAAADERRHHAMLEAMRGRAPRDASNGAPPPSTPSAVTLRELAETNAVEGTVREALAALTVAHQARSAGDATTRAIFAAIAEDELEHALLSLDIDRWVGAQLDEVDHDAVGRARVAALAALEAELAAEPEVLDDESRWLGVPDRATRAAWLHDLAARS